MPPKRTDKFTSNKKKEKIRRLNDEQVNVSVGSENRSLNTLEKELESALDQNDPDESCVLYLAQQVAKKPNVSPPLAIRLFKFCITVGNERIVQLLVNQNIVNLKTSEGGKLMWTTVDCGQVDIAAIFVRSGADLSVRKTEKNRTLLHEVLNSWNIKDNAKRDKLIRLMLVHGADVNACDDRGHSILHEAICNDRCSSELVETILQHGANVSINEEINLDDIFWASSYKPELLPRLLEHQVPDEQTRNQRGLLAIQNLLLKSKRYTGTKFADTLKLIKQILDMGVPVNTVHPFSEKRRRYDRPMPLLSTALFIKKKDSVKLLLDYGADPHQKDGYGHTPLYQATALAGYTHACRWLIERGANIHTPNDDSMGCYPIHGAYLNESVKNIHLLLNLGADINITDKRGLTPFQCTKDTYYLKDHHRLFIKYFALMVAKGKTVSDDDMKFATKYVWGSYHYKLCTVQLDQMKKEYVCDRVSYFSLFSDNMYNTLKLIKNPDFVRNFKNNEQKRNTLFPQYTYMLLHEFEIAEMRCNLLRREEEMIKEVVEEIFFINLCELVVEKIARYSSTEKLERCRYDYFLNFHKNLKNTKADKDKIL